LGDDLWHERCEYHQPSWKDLLLRNVKWFRGGLVLEAHGLFVSLNSRIQSNPEEEEALKETPIRHFLQKLILQQERGGASQVVEIRIRISGKVNLRSQDGPCGPTVSVGGSGCSRFEKAESHKEKEIQRYLARKKPPPPLGPP